MLNVKRLAEDRWIRRWIGAIVAGLLIWFIGPLVAVADHHLLSWWPMKLGVALMPLLLVVLLRWRWGWKEARKSALLPYALAMDTQAAESQEMEEKVAGILRMLRHGTQRRNGSAAYRLPWYAMIGAADAGKTTMLLDVGVSCAAEMEGNHAVFGGQRDTSTCDWLIADEAVLIDTAGRYVTQEAGTPDAASWRAFLHLLKRHRPLQPLNGILVAIPASDLLDAVRLNNRAGHLRSRLMEAGQELGQDLPIYLMLTKADLLPGFRAFFARNTNVEDAQVFGSTAPDGGSDAAAVMAGYDALITRVASRMVSCMQEEADLSARAEIAAFPAQLASLRPALATLLGQISHTTRFERPICVRGIYLTSGAQAGGLGDGMPPPSPGYGGQPRHSFFLKRLFRDVIFPEQGLASRNVAAEKMQRRGYRIAIAASVAVLAICLFTWSFGYFKNQRLITAVRAAAQAYSATGVASAGSPAPEVELTALDVLGKVQADTAAAGDFALGLGQADRLSQEIGTVYQHDLERRLTPMLATLAADRMIADADQPATLFNDLKSYLILGGHAPASDRQALAVWVGPAWLARDKQAAAQTPDEVTRHVLALASFAFAPVAIDPSRVEATRRIIRAQPAAVRIYEQLKAKALARNDAIWAARDNAGPQPFIFFAETGAFAPGAGVPRLFTRAGYEKIFLPTLASGPALLREEQWVVGDVSSAPFSNKVGLPQLKADLGQLYFQEFLTRWRDYMMAMTPHPAKTIQDTIQHLRDGSGPLSPLPPVLRAIAVQTDMTSTSVDRPSFLSGAGLWFRRAPSGSDAGPRQIVIQAFEPLRLLVGKPSAPAPLDAVLASMNRLADSLTMVAVLPDGGGAAGEQVTLNAKVAIAQLQQNGSALPLPTGTIVQAIVENAAGTLGSARARQVKSAMNQGLGASCRQVLNHAYPFSSGMREISLTDFTRLFGPQGIVATFVARNLNGYVDTSKPQWTALPGATDVHVMPADILSLQQAAAITRMFFALDPTVPRLTYQIEPVALIGAKAVKLTIDGQTLEFDGKTPLPAIFDWPGSGGATVTFTDDEDAKARSWSGNWAAFRAMQAAAVRMAASPGLGIGSFNQGAARFKFRVRTFIGANPFTIGYLKTICF